MRTDKCFSDNGDFPGEVFLILFIILAVLVAICIIPILICAGCTFGCLNLVYESFWRLPVPFMWHMTINYVDGLANWSYSKITERFCNKKSEPQIIELPAQRTVQMVPAQYPNIEINNHVLQYNTKTLKYEVMDQAIPWSLIRITFILCRTIMI